jgi:hypothetical protein
MACLATPESGSLQTANSSDDTTDVFMWSERCNKVLKFSAGVQERVAQANGRNQKDMSF